MSSVPTERHNYTWRIKFQDTTTEDFTAYQLSFSERDVATFCGYGEDGRWVPLLTLAPGSYRSIRLLPSGPQAHGELPPCSTCKGAGEVEVEGYFGTAPCPDCTQEGVPAALGEDAGSEAAVEKVAASA